jgi:hypothetical protein
LARFALKNRPQTKEAWDLTLADTAAKFIAWKQKDVGETIRQYSVDKLEETLGFVGSYWRGYSKIPVRRLARPDMDHE